MKIGLEIRRRGFLRSAVVAALAASSGACVRVIDKSDGGVTGPREAPTEAAESLPAVAEALWVADGSGGLHAYDGRAQRVTAHVDAHADWMGMPPDLVAGAGLIWTYAGDGRIVAVDPRGARVTMRASVPMTSPPADVCVGVAFGALWIARSGGLWRVSSSGRVSRIGLPKGLRPGAIAVFRGRLWLVDRRDGSLAYVTASGSEASSAGRAPIGRIGLLRVGRAGLFLVPVNGSRAWLFDPSTAAGVSTVALPRGELISDMFAAGPDMWMIGGNGTVAGITGGRSVAVSHAVRISDTSQGFPAAVGLGSLWVCDEVYGRLVRVEPDSGRISARMTVPAADPDDPAFAVLAGRHSVWLVDTNDADGVMRVDPEAGRVARLARSTGVSRGVSAIVAAPPRNPR
jgi:hypothetical protein